MKMQLLICDIDEHKQDYEFTVWYSLIGNARPTEKLSDAFSEMVPLLNKAYIKIIRHKSVCLQIADELVPLNYVKTDMTVQEVYDKVRSEQNKKGDTL